MVTLQKLLDFGLQQLLPLAIAAGTFLFLTAYLEDQYLKSNLDLFWKKVLKIALILGLTALIISVIIHSKPYAIARHYILMGVNWLQGTAIFGSAVTAIQRFFQWVHNLFTTWTPIYWRWFSLVYLFGLIIELFALKWRITFWRAFNVIWPAVVKFPRIFLYFFGYQTPIQDVILAGILKAKVRENLNDSYEDAVQGFDDRGQPFKDGAGGTAQTQTRKAVAQAMKRTKIKVRTTTAGQRVATILIRQSRETETDRAIENTLKGFGQRVSGNSIYFPSDPTYSTELKGYVFTSSVAYDAGDELGSYKAIFANPFSTDNAVTAQGGTGQGALATMWNDMTNTVDYLTHLTPYAVYSRLTKRTNRLYSRDTSADKAKYKVQQNLDLSVIPEPKDPETGNGIAEQRQLALDQAKGRVKSLTSALSGFGIYGQFKQVKVGGNTAIYEYVLPPDAKLPNDFDKIQNQIGNLLRINQKPIITLSAGVLTISMENGVPIPISFSDMIKTRKKGTSNIISGMVGVDALGNDIYFELGDKNPHAMFFGKTGTGKTVSIMTILYSVMSATDPKHLRIAYVDGKGNSFEFMKNDGEHPNPFTFAPPADASGDINYARAVIVALERETRRRIDLFKKASVSKLAVYNKMQEKAGLPILPEILAVIDEFSAITQQDKQLKVSELNKYGTIDKVEYIAKMSRSVGIRMLLANQSARKELVPGKISANVTGRVSLGVSEPIESEIALPETGIKVNLISQPGEFYSIMNGPNHPEHGNGPYLPDDVMNALNDSLTKKFGKCEYVMTREQIFETAGLDDEENKSTSDGEQTENDDNQNSDRPRLRAKAQGRSRQKPAKLIRPEGVNLSYLRQHPEKFIELIENDHDSKIDAWWVSKSSKFLAENPVFKKLPLAEQQRLQRVEAEKTMQIEERYAKLGFTIPRSHSIRHAEARPSVTESSRPHAGTVKSQVKSTLHGKDGGAI